MYRSTRQKQGDIYSPEQIERVLSTAGIKIEREWESDFIVFCPYHNNFRTPAGEISKESGLFFCFSCQEVKTLPEFIMTMTKKSYFETLRLIDSCSTETDLVSEINRIMAKDPEPDPLDESIVIALHEMALASPRALGYYESRGISLDSVHKFTLGYSEKMDMVTTPVHSPNGLSYLGFVGRSVEGKDFKNTTGNWRSHTLFNLNRVKNESSVCVVESNFDAIRLNQNGIPTVATLGAYTSKSQIELMKRYFTFVTLIADNDEGGDKMIQKMTKRLGSRVSVIRIPKRFKDVGDMTDEDIQKLSFALDNPLLSMV